MIANEYKRQIRETGGKVNITKLAELYSVSRGFIRKVINEIHVHGKVLHPNSIEQARDRGAGAIALDRHDSIILLNLYYREPARSLRSYVEGLFLYTGKLVGVSTISDFWLRAFPISASLRETNTIPENKFSEYNLFRAHEYLNIIGNVRPEIVKFGDEKLLKGVELYNRKPRRNVLDGTVPPVLVSNDYRNTYSLIGFCGIDPRTIPVFYTIHNEVNDSISFAKHIERSIVYGFLYTRMEPY